MWTGPGTLPRPDDLRRLKAKMGWEHIPWYPLTGDLHADFEVDQRHGTNAFIRDGHRAAGRGEARHGCGADYRDPCPSSSGSVVL